MDIQDNTSMADLDMDDVEYLVCSRYERDHAPIESSDLDPSDLNYLPF